MFTPTRSIPQTTISGAEKKSENSPLSVSKDGTSLAHQHRANAVNRNSPKRRWQLAKNILLTETSCAIQVGKSCILGEVFRWHVKTTQLGMALRTPDDEYLISNRLRSPRLRCRQSFRLHPPFADEFIQAKKKLSCGALVVSNERCSKRDAGCAKPRVHQPFGASLSFLGSIIQAVLDCSKGPFETSCPTVRCPPWHSS